uniref:Uncharacterized protein n=1 Tax=Haptolina ericina TaxID=156174 RepID=A0A7S3ATY6_9EUKA|mmetsp:Transcript_3205/g.6935  ORF Transcript_3205/g.6935 Transcript_3205/m.6935 type:complete len:119 (+) Transcript_3205:50-406(+)
MATVLAIAALPIAVVIAMLTVLLMDYYLSRSWVYSSARLAGFEGAEGSGGGRGGGDRIRDGGDGIGSRVGASSDASDASGAVGLATCSADITIGVPNQMLIPTPEDSPWGSSASAYSA